MNHSKISDQLSEANEPQVEKVGVKTYYAYTYQDRRIYFVQDSRLIDSTKIDVCNILSSSIDVQNKTINLTSIMEGLYPSFTEFYGDRATIALQVKGNEVHYGIAVCDKNDHFNKAEGRKKAKERLENAFQVTDITAFRKQFPQMSDHQIALHFLNTKTAKVYKDLEKYARRIAIFNGKQITFPKKKEKVTLASEKIVSEVVS